MPSKSKTLHQYQTLAAFILRTIKPEYEARRIKEKTFGLGGALLTEDDLHWLLETADKYCKPFDLLPDNPYVVYDFAFCIELQLYILKAIGFYYIQQEDLRRREYHERMLLLLSPLKLHKNHNSIQILRHYFPVLHWFIEELDKQISESPVDEKRSLIPKVREYAMNLISCWEQNHRKIKEMAIANPEGNGVYFREGLLTYYKALSSLAQYDMLDKRFDKVAVILEKSMDIFPQLTPVQRNLVEESHLRNRVFFARALQCQEKLQELDLAQRKTIERFDVASSKIAICFRDNLIYFAEHQPLIERDRYKLIYEQSFYWFCDLIVVLGRLKFPRYEIARLQKEREAPIVRKKRNERHSRYLHTMFSNYEVRKKMHEEREAPLPQAWVTEGEDLSLESAPRNLEAALSQLELLRHLLAFDHEKRVLLDFILAYSRAKSADRDDKLRAGQLFLEIRKRLLEQEGARTTLSWNAEVECLQELYRLRAVPDLMLFSMLKELIDKADASPVPLMGISEYAQALLNLLLLSVSKSYFSGRSQLEYAMKGIRLCETYPDESLINFLYSSFLSVALLYAHDKELRPQLLIKLTEFPIDTTPIASATLELAQFYLLTRDDAAAERQLYRLITSIHMEDPLIEMRIVTAHARVLYYKLERALIRLNSNSHLKLIEAIKICQWDDMTKLTNREKFFLNQISLTAATHLGWHFFDASLTETSNKEALDNLQKAKTYFELAIGFTDSEEERLFFGENIEKCVDLIKEFTRTMDLEAHQRRVQTSKEMQKKERSITDYIQLSDLHSAAIHANEVCQKNADDLLKEWAKECSEKDRIQGYIAFEEGTEHQISTLKALQQRVAEGQKDHASMRFSERIIKQMREQIDLVRSMLDEQDIRESTKEAQSQQLEIVEATAETEMKVVPCDPSSALPIEMAKLKLFFSDPHHFDFRLRPHPETLADIERIFAMIVSLNRILDLEEIKEHVVVNRKLGAFRASLTRALIVPFNDHRFIDSFVVIETILKTQKPVQALVTWCQDPMNDNLQQYLISCKVSLELLEIPPETLESILRALQRNITDFGRASEPSIAAISLLLLWMYWGGHHLARHPLATPMQVAMGRDMAQKLYVLHFQLAHTGSQTTPLSPSSDMIMAALNRVMLDSSPRLSGSRDVLFHARREGGGVDLRESEYNISL